MLIDFEVTPGTKTVQVPSGYNIWRKRFEVRLSSAAQKGKANQQLIEKLSEILGIKQSDVLLVSGQTSHKKTVLIRGIQQSRILDELVALLEKD